MSDTRLIAYAIVLAYAVVATACVASGKSMHLDVLAFLADRLLRMLRWLYLWSVRVDAAIRAGADQYVTMLDKQDQDKGGV